jgi:hypothetical protein
MTLTLEHLGPQALAIADNVRDDAPLDAHLTRVATIQFSLGAAEGNELPNDSDLSVAFPPDALLSLARRSIPVLNRHGRGKSGVAD